MLSSHTTSRARPFGAFAGVPLVLAIMVTLVAAPATAHAAAAGAEPRWSNAGTFEFDRGPVRGHITAASRFIGTSASFLSSTSSGSLDLWTADAILAAEVPVPMAPLSVYGQVVHRYLASGDDRHTGWSDATLGVKGELYRDAPLLFSVFGTIVVPVGREDVNLLDHTTTLRIGLASTIMPFEFFAINANIVFGNIWDLEWPDGEVRDTLEFSFLVEAVIMAPFVDLFSGRIGLRGSYREDAFDKDAFYLYAQVNALMFFARVGVPFAVDKGIAGVQQGLETGEVNIYVGIDFEF